jgi:hypothetical protein
MAGISSVFILKAQYTKRCSVQSSISYIKNLFLYMHFLFSKWTKFCATNFYQDHLLVLYKFIFFLFWSFYYLICLVKREQNIPQDAAWKALQFTSNSLLIYMNLSFFKWAKFYASNKWSWWKLITQNFFYFENKECIYKIRFLM